MLKNPAITGFIAVSDYLAYGVWDALAEHGFRVPEDYSVCGCDDLFASSLPGISLTSVNPHNNEKGKRAFDLLYRKMTAAPQAEEPISIIQVEYLSTLIVRNSTSRPAPRPLAGGDSQRKAERNEV